MALEQSPANRQPPALRTPSRDAPSVFRAAKRRQNDSPADEAPRPVARERKHCWQDEELIVEIESTPAPDFSLEGFSLDYERTTQHQSTDASTTSSYRPDTEEPPLRTSPKEPLNYNGAHDHVSHDHASHNDAPRDDDPAAAPLRKSTMRRKAYSAALALLVLVSGAYFAISKRGQPTRQTARTQEPQTMRAVLAGAHAPEALPADTRRTSQVGWSPNAAFVARRAKSDHAAAARPDLEASPAPETIAAAWPLAKLRQPLLITVDQLDEAIVAGEQAEGDLLRIDLTEQAGVRRLGRAYIRLCRLAECLTLLDATVEKEEASARKLLGKLLLQDAVRDADNREDLAELGFRWLRYDARPNSGVVLAGRVVDLTARGEDTEYAVEVRCDLGSVVARVLVPGRPHSVGDALGVIGVIIQRPRDNLLDYRGDAQSLVLAYWAFDPLWATGDPAGDTLTRANSPIGP